MFEVKVGQNSYPTKVLVCKAWSKSKCERTVAMDACLGELPPLLTEQASTRRKLSILVNHPYGELDAETGLGLYLQY